MLLLYQRGNNTILIMAYATNGQGVCIYIFMHRDEHYKDTSNITIIMQYKMVHKSTKNAGLTNNAKI